MSKTKKIENLAYAFMKEQITNEIWPEGMQIKELAVAEELEISRTPIRKALKRLAEENLVYFKPNKGVYVRSQPLGLKEQKERIYYLEVILQHVLYTLQLEEINVRIQPLDAQLKSMHTFISDTSELFEKTEIEFWKSILEYHSNSYMNQRVIQTLNSLYEKSAKTAPLFAKSRSTKLTHYTNLVAFILDRNYTYARREVRILLNQLLINLIQDVD